MTAICIKCKHCLHANVFNTKSPLTWYNYVCGRAKQDLVLDPVTGEMEGPPKAGAMSGDSFYLFCRTINVNGQCAMFEPKKNT